MMRIYAVFLLASLFVAATGLAIASLAVWTTCSAPTISGAPNKNPIDHQRHAESTRLIFH